MIIHRDAPPDESPTVGASERAVVRGNVAGPKGVGWLWFGESGRGFVKSNTTT